jgi:hypothetical protein
MASINLVKSSEMSSDGFMETTLTWPTHLYNPFFFFAFYASWPIHGDMLFMFLPLDHFAVQFPLAGACRFLFLFWIVF